MPKVSKHHSRPRDPVPSSPCASTTRERRVRVKLVKELGFKMGFRCERCEKKNL